jgi:DNA-binding NarL/FixJ family response regulator
MYDPSFGRVTVLAVENDHVARQALGLMLADERLEVIGIVGTAYEAIEKIRDHPPQVALIDMHLGHNPREGIQLIQQVRYHSPSTACLVLTAPDVDTDLVPNGISAGAEGYFRKGYMHGENLPAVIISLAAGQPDISQTTAVKLLQRVVAAQMLASASYPEPRLSEFEHEVLRRAAHGQSAHAIAEQLRLPEATVRRHWHNIAHKFY